MVKRDTSTQANLVREIKEIAMRKIEYEESLNSFIGNEAEKASEEYSQSDVVFVSATTTTKNKRRFE